MSDQTANQTISEKQLAANRANAQKSTGPRTEEGKRRSALNGMRHGLTAQVTVMTEPDRAAKEIFCTRIIEEFDPRSHRELQLAQAYATLQWRINRCSSLEENIFAIGLLQDSKTHDTSKNESYDAISEAQTFLLHSAKFDTLSVYAQRLMNQAEKILKQLNQFQQERKIQEHQPEPAAKTAAAPKPDTAPPENGFVCAAGPLFRTHISEIIPPPVSNDQNRVPAQEKMAA